jgi:hypothetical protein
VERAQNKPHVTEAVLIEGSDMVQVDTVIFFGAGASKAEGAPLQGELLQKFLERNWDEPEITRIQARVRAFLNAFFTAGLGDETFPTFEEILGILDIALQRNEGFKGYPNSAPKSALIQAREDIVQSISVTLDKELGIGRSPHHQTLVNRLGEDGSLLRTAFVSLNYDIILDSELVGAQSHHDVDVDYALEFLNYRNRRTDRDWARPRKGKSVKLLKPHGSLNWLFCSACGGIHITPKEKGAASLALRSIECSACGCPTQAIIAPPTYFKNMQNYHLQHIWHQTELVFSQASRIVFCGYSFPDADMHIKYLIKRAEVTAGRMHEVHVFNKNPRSRAPNSETKARYHRFFRGTKVTYWERTFQQFASEGIPSRS